MKFQSEHINEQTLTRFILKDTSLTARERTAIAAHLDRCSGCSELYSQIAEFFQNTEAELKANSTLAERHTGALITSKQDATLWTEPVSSIIPQHPVSVHAKIWYAIRKRPVTSTVGFAGMFAVVFFALNTLVFRSSNENINPTHFQFEGNSVVVFNKNGEKLWSKPATDYFNLSVVSPQTCKLIHVVDLDDDGINEIITVLSFYEEGFNGKGYVTAINYDGTIKWRKRLGREVQLSDRKYPVNFQVRKLVYSSELRRIFVTLMHSNSPSALYSLDFNGNVVGELWNYGHMLDLVLVPAENGMPPSMVLTVIDDDKNEPVISSFPANRLAGVRQMYGGVFLGIEQAEYIGMNVRLVVQKKFVRTRYGFPEILLLDDGKLEVRYGPFPSWLFSLIFNQDLSLNEILFTDTALETYGNQGIQEQMNILKSSLVYSIGNNTVPIKKNNPFSAMLNNATNGIRILDQEHKTLWSLSYFGERKLTQLDITNSLAIHDIDNDGFNEVITTIESIGENTGKNNILRAFKANGQLLFRKEYSRTIEFTDAVYGNDYSLRNILAADCDRDGKNELYVGLAHKHSPFALLKLDATGNILGEYWHYGHYWDMYISSFGSDHEQLILCGVNDDLSQSNALVTIIDPNKLTGVKRSALSNQYPFETSIAEEINILFPRTLIDEAYDAKPRVVSRSFEDTLLIGFVVRSESGKVPYNAIEYLFSNSWGVKDIKAYDATKRIMESLFREKKIHTPYSQDYRKGLFNQVRVLRQKETS